MLCTDTQEGSLVWDVIPYGDHIENLLTTQKALNIHEC